MANAGFPPRLMGSGNMPRSTRCTRNRTRAFAAMPSPRSKAFHREALDALALVSQQRADMAIKENRFAKSVVPVLNEDGTVALDREEFPRPETTAEGLASLKPAFAGMMDFDLGGGVTFRKQINRRYPDVDIKPVHHAGNSSGVVDGAAALLITSTRLCRKARPQAARAHRGLCNQGDDPTLMLNAPGSRRQEGSRQGGPDQGRHRRLGNQRGLRRRRREVHPRPRS